MEVAFKFHVGVCCKYPTQMVSESCDLRQLLISGAYFKQEKFCVVAHPLKVKQHVDWKMLSIKSTVGVTKSHAL